MTMISIDCKCLVMVKYCPKGQKNNLCLEFIQETKLFNFFYYCINIQDYNLDYKNQDII